jgi:hypothetical protein
VFFGFGLNYWNRNHGHHHGHRDGHWGQRGPSGRR